MGIVIIIRNRGIASLQSSMSLDDSLKYHKVFFPNHSTFKRQALEKKKENNKSTLLRHWPLRRFKHQLNSRALNIALHFTFFKFPFPIPRFSNIHLTCGTFRSGFANKTSFNWPNSSFVFFIAKLSSAFKKYAKIIAKTFYFFFSFGYAIS